MSMEWLRWYHGCVTDPKFPLIARRSGQNVASVLAVWAALLERASQASERGSVAGFDCESFDALLGLEDGACQAILSALESKGMVINDRIEKWDERQNKDETATERKRLQRDRERLSRERAEFEALQASCHAMSCDVTDSHAPSQDVTGGHAMSLRLDKIREEINTGGGGECAGARVADSVPENRPDLAEDRAEPAAPETGGREGPKKTDCPSKGSPEWPAFLSCLQVYPVQQGKEEAWREWMRLKANGTLAQAWEIRDAILRLSAEDSRWLRGKVPKMAKWLNGKGWDDEPFVEPETAALPAVRDGPRSGFSQPVARTQHQKGRQDMEGVAKLVLAAEKELEHGDYTAHYGGTRQDGNPLPAANERGRTAGIDRSMDGALP